jgi:hypothetical protein
MLQYYSALPFTITSGVASLQGTTGRPLANGGTAPSNFDVRAVSFIPRNARIGSDFFSLNARMSRALRISGSVKAEGLVEAFKLSNRLNNLTPGIRISSPARANEPGDYLQPNRRRRRSENVSIRTATDFLKRSFPASGKGPTMRAKVLSAGIAFLLLVAAPMAAAPCPEAIPCLRESNSLNSAPCSGRPER